MTAMRYSIIMIVGLWLSVAHAQGQEVAFASPSVEEGVRQHLGFTEEEPIGFTQLDTITTLDLSHRGITDIRDVVLMPKLRMLDLSDNRVADLQPLCALDSLEWVDLSYNALRGINDLFFSSAKSLTVNVAFNHIRDFSLFGSMSSCSFVLEGAGLQFDENAPYFEVFDFYADVDDDDNPFVCYRGFTNMEAGASLICGSLHTAAQMDGNANSISLPGHLSATTQAILSNGVMGDTTWVVPPTRRSVADGGELSIITQLPESYEIGYLQALHGTVSADGLTLHYTAPSPAVADTIYLSYYEDNRTKGFAQLYIASTQTPTEVRAVAESSPFTMSLHGNILHIEGCSERWKEVKAIRVYDGIGRLLDLRLPNSGQDVDIRLSAKHSVVIVEVLLDKQRLVTKVKAQ